MMNAWNEEEGQTLVLLAFCIAILLGFVAIATDAGVMFHTRRQAQTAADSAVIAAAQQLNFGDATAAAQQDAARNGFTNGVDEVTVQVDDPPANGPAAGKVGYVEVIVTKQQPTFFMRVFGVNSLTVAAKAVATALPSTNCYTALSPTGTAIKIAGTADIQSPGCSSFSDSASSTSTQIAGTATVNLAGEYSVGTYATDGTPAISVQPSSNALPIPDPLAYLQAPSYSGCQSAPNTSPLSPGCYNGLTINSAVSLSPGTYVINGPLKVTSGGSLTGTGVTLYITSKGSVSVESQSTVNLSAPTSGTYNGILFFQSRSDSKSATFAGGDSAILQGILYFPDALVDWVGGSTSGQTDPPTAMSVIASQIKLAGTDTIENYAAVNSKTPLDAPRLVG